MEVPGTPEEAFIREWTPCSHILNLIPAKMQAGIFSSELSLTCVDAVTEFIALGTNMGLVYWYDRKKGNIQRLRCEATTSPITFVKIVNTVDYMVGAGNADGQVTVFQIPKEHPENVPESLKPKVEPKVERYTIGDLHKSPITAIEWSKNGMRLFSGDKNGVIIMTEIDFYMHLCKSMEIVNEGHEIVALSVHAGRLLVGSAYRAIVVRREDARWQVTQIGTKDRKSLCRLGAVWMHSYARGAGGAAAAAYCARPGLRVWRADEEGTVHQTLLFKDAISNPLTVAELLNPSPLGRRAATPAEPSLSRLHVFRERFLVAHDERTLCVLDPNNLTAVAVVDELRNILSVSVSTDEIFVLEGPRSLLRLAPRPDPAPPLTDDPINLMTKSLTTSIQQAVNTVRDLTHIDQTVPYITSVLEQPISIFTNNIDTTLVGTAEECVELPPIKTLPTDMTRNVLESIINEFQGVSDTDEIRKAKSDELQRKLKLYNSIMEKKCDEELIHSSRRTRRREVGSGGSTPRTGTPQREPRGRSDVSYTTPCVMNVSVYGNIPDQNDDLLEKQIEEKEKILAKMLNLESLSIKTPKLDNQIAKEENDFSIPLYKRRAEENQVAKEENNFSSLLYKKRTEEKPFIESPKHVKKPTNGAHIPKKDPNPIDLVPKVVKLPNNWNLENIELRLDMKTNGINNGKNLMSPDESLDADWEII